ncbi:NADH:ubiquinone oxidoreductase 22 kDa subunit [Dunaliella salina]|uniref:NADH:ubiquinone oxidoreductase 22 kDa subunit n=1 Tax=Dunaliella salina TaxID=3046 RepID=A0ABQ7G3D3_DUNSA|nr:NADH:ubiquinone oxidoreductase 22 kDa subunit [Dunaliella salina]|eukprot:KAF5829110.1 NADH:ubiquinone oxidoreductase 22 kDa subunit [Dunaliella salina]
MLKAAGASLRRALAAVSTSPLESSSRLIASSSAVQGGADEHHGYEQTPTVFDRLVTINVVDLDGKRRSVRAVVGQTLAQVLVEAGYPRTYFFPNMGFYTQHIVDAHVFIPQDYWSKIRNYKEDSDEADAIKRTFRDMIQDYAKSTSYLASYIDIVPEFNNMTIGIGPVKPWVLHSEWAFNGVHDDPTPQFKEPTTEIWG